MNRTSQFEMQTDNNKKTMSPILQCDISDKMTITSIKHKNKLKRSNTDNDSMDEPLELNEINSSRKIAKIINETEDNIQQIFKFTPNHHNHHTHHENNHTFHNRYHRSSHRKITRARYPHSSHANSHPNNDNNNNNHSYNNYKHPNTHNTDKRRGKKRKRDLGSDTDDTLSSHTHTSQPRKRRKKSIDDRDKKRIRIRTHSHSHSSGHSSSNSDSSYRKSRRKKKDKIDRKNKKKKHNHNRDCVSDSDDNVNRKKEKHKQHKELEIEEKTQHIVAEISPSPSLSISSLAITNKKHHYSKSRSRSRSKRRDYSHSRSRTNSPSSSSSNSHSHTPCTTSSDSDNHKRVRKIIRYDYECSSGHNPRTSSDSESDTCSDSDSESDSSSSTSSSQNTPMEERTSNKFRENLNQKLKLPTTRNLLLTGKFFFQRMSEGEIIRTIRYRFEMELDVEFWKYQVVYEGRWYCKHLQCISITFATSQLCQEGLSKFVCGLVDLNEIGEGVNASLDQYKNRAKKYYEKHMKKTRELTENVLGKNHVVVDECVECVEEIVCVGRYYSLPFFTQPLRCFKRPEIVNNECKIVQSVCDMRVEASEERVCSKGILHVGKIEKKQCTVDIPLRMKCKKNKAAIIQSKKMIEKHQHSLNLKVIKVKTSKHVSKKRKHCEIMVENNKISPMKKKIKIKKNTQIPVPVPVRGGTWRDYVDLYEGKESLATLHFECMQVFKDELIERCVEEEYIRIMQLQGQEVKVKIRSKFESSCESTPENEGKVAAKLRTKKKKIIESEASSDDSSSEEEKKIKNETNSSEIKLETNMNRLTNKLQSLSTMTLSMNKMNKKTDDLKTPQSPNNTQLQAKFPSITYRNTPHTTNTNTLPFNLPQISFTRPHYTTTTTSTRRQPPPPVIKPLFTSSESHLTVSQPMAASYPSQQLSHTTNLNYNPYINTQYMSLYSSPIGYAQYANHTQPYYIKNDINHTQPITYDHSNNSKNFKLNLNHKIKDKFPTHTIPNFDISVPINAKQMYCDTVSSLSNTSNTSTSSHSITSIITEKDTVNANVDKNKKNYKELISPNGQWIIRGHDSGCARTEGYYSLAPANKRKKFRHLAAVTPCNRERNRFHIRRAETITRERERESSSTLSFRQKNIQFGKSSIHSWGVFALEEMNAEEMVVEYIGEYIKEKYANLREKLYEKQGYDDYMFRVENDLIIDATKKGNLARFINHSCDPNCYTRIIQVANTPRVVIYSKRYIKAGEELTYDYKFPIEEDKIQCLCGSKNCRGTLN